MLFNHPSDQSDDNSDDQAVPSRSTPDLPGEAERKAAEKKFLEGEEETSAGASRNLARSKCAYCQNTDHKCLGQCMECKQYFCNTVLSEIGSHLVVHLVRAKHRQVRLHKDSSLGHLVFECLFCRKRNVFTLGFAPHWEDKRTDVIMCCRDYSCLSQEYISNHGLKVSEWEPIIKEKRFVDFLLQSKPPGQTPGTITPTIKAIYEYENSFQAGKRLTMDEVLTHKVRTVKAPNVQLQWINIDQYFNTFGFLVELEIEEDRKLYDKMIFEQVEINWDAYEPAKKRLSFFLPVTDEVNTKSMKRQEVILIDERTEQAVAVCSIVDVLANDKILAVVSSEEKELRRSPTYNIRLVFKPTSFMRMLDGLNSLRTRAPQVIDPDIFQILLGNVYALKNTQLKVPPVKKAAFQSIPNSPPLNESQVAAAEKALTNRFSLLQGPPGTGKSVLSASIIYYLVKVAQTVQKNSYAKIMVCAPSNIAIDHLTSYLKRTGVKVLQVCSRVREKIDAPVGDAFLHNIIDQHLQRPENADLRLLRDKTLEGDHEAGKRTAWASKEYDLSVKIIREYDVVCTTCVSSFDPRLVPFRFPIVLVDEATQAIEPEGILPLLKRAEQVILVGDHMQLGPVVMSTEAARAGLKQSFFERMIKLGVAPIRLQIQYRMHPELSIFSSETFYEGGLQNGVNASQRKNETLDFPWPNPARPLLFWHVVGKEEFSSTGTSYLNKIEAEAVEKVIEAFYNAGLEKGKLCVITPYKGQRAYLKTMVSHHLAADNQFYESIEINSIDSFQGREKDYVIISAVRSSDSSGIGFLNDERRLNVALTRSKYGMIIVGNCHSLAKGPFWRSLLAHCSTHRLIYEGSSVQTLRPSMITFEKPENLVAFDKAKAIREMNLDDLKSSKLKGYMMQEFRKSDLGFTQLPSDHRGDR